MKVKAQTGSMMMMPEATELIDMAETRAGRSIRRKRSNILISSLSEVVKQKKNQKLFGI